MIQLRAILQESRGQNARSCVNNDYVHCLLPDFTIIMHWGLSLMMIQSLFLADYTPKDMSLILSSLPCPFTDTPSTQKQI